MSLTELNIKPMDVGSLIYRLQWLIWTVFMLTLWQGCFIKSRAMTDTQALRRPQTSKDTRCQCTSVMKNIFGTGEFHA